METVTLLDALNYVSLSELYASPAGEAVVYKTHAPRLESNDYEHQAWLYAHGTFEEIPYFSGKVLWEEEGTILLASEKGGRTEILRLAASGTQNILLEIPEPAALVGKTRTGGVLYTVTTNIEQKQRLEHASEQEYDQIKEEYRLQSEDCIIADEFPYWSDERGSINKIRTILFLYENGQTVQLTEDLFDCRQVVYSPRDDSVWVTGGSFSVQAPLKNGLYRINLHSLETTEIIGVGEKSIWGLEIWNSKAAIVSDGVYVWEQDRFQKEFETELSFGNSVFSDVVYGSGTSLAACGGKLYFIATDKETSNIWSLDENMTLKQETVGNHVIHGFAVTEKGIYWIGLSDLRHQELYLQERNGSSQITDYHSDKYQNKELARPEQLSFLDPYGKTIVGWVLRPVGQKEGVQYPAILDIHGGPRGAYGAVYFHEMQYWAAKGYFVLFANPSGGTGRGTEFLKVEQGLGGEDYENLMDFVDLALDTYPEIDPNRLGVTGGSYGGFLTNWIIGHTTRFAAAVSQRSTANHITESAAKDIAPGFIRSMTDPQADDRFERLWEGSPLRFIGKNVTTPTLFLHSLNDYRCYHIESVQMYAALQYFHVPTRMVLFKNEHHGLSRDGHPRNRIRRLQEITEWMDRYLKKEEEIR